MKLFNLDHRVEFLAEVIRESPESRLLCFADWRLNRSW